jgi:hypothetical protein
VLGPEIGANEPYPKFTAALHTSGIATVVLHPRGTGFSDGVRGDIDDYGLFLADLQLGLEQAQKVFPGSARITRDSRAWRSATRHMTWESRGDKCAIRR